MPHFFNRIFKRDYKPYKPSDIIEKRKESGFEDARPLLSSDSYSSNLTDRPNNKILSVIEEEIADSIADWQSLPTADNLDYVILALKDVGQLDVTACKDAGYYLKQLDVEACFEGYSEPRKLLSNKKIKKDQEAYANLLFLVEAFEAKQGSEDTYTPPPSPTMRA